MELQVQSMRLRLCALLVVFSCLAERVRGQYTPDWTSLDSRPTPQWWLDSKFTLFAHWGLYAVPSYCSPPTDTTCYAEWYWNHLVNPSPDDPVLAFHIATYGADFKYQQFVDKFTCELFDADEWADIFYNSGAKALVLTSKHHEGFAMWPSEQAWNWNSYDVGPHRDLLGEVGKAVRARGLRFGFYHSFFEWFNPIYANNGTQFVEDHFLPMITDLVNSYQPDVMYADGEWDHDSDWWQTKPWLAWLYNESPVKDSVLINDRYGNECPGVHGTYFICEYSGEVGGSCVTDNPTHPWTAHEGMGSSFGYNRIDIYRPPEYFINLLFQSVAYGGHLELNVGPTGDGRISDAQKNILLAIGSWLKVNGNAIYATTGYPFGLSNACVKSSDGLAVKTCFTHTGTTVNAITSSWPHDPYSFDQLIVPNPNSQVTLLGSNATISYTYDSTAQRFTIHVPQLTIDQLPSPYAWAFQITNVANVLLKDKQHQPIPIATAQF